MTGPHDTNPPPQDVGESRTDLGNLLRRVIRFESDSDGARTTLGAGGEWPEVDRLLREAFVLAGPFQPAVSLVDPVLAGLRAEGMIGSPLWWPGWVRRTGAGLGAILLLLIGCGLAVLLALSSATLAAFGVAGAAVWSSRALVIVFEAWSRLMAALSGTAETVRSILLGDAAPLVGVSLLACSAVVLVGFLLALRTTQSSQEVA